MIDMKILYLGPARQGLMDFLKQDGNEIINSEHKIYLDDVHDVDFILCFGYRHIITWDIIRLFPNQIINLHISYLPWNRGADPNLWSFLEDTPKGVSIHYIDSGLDTGDIIVQEKIDYSEYDTLKDTYERLIASIEQLFFVNWESIKTKRCSATKQSKELGTYHKMKDKEQYLNLLTNSWNTRVYDLLGKAKMND